LRVHEPPCPFVRAFQRSANLINTEGFSAPVKLLPSFIHHPHHPAASRIVVTARRAASIYCSLIASLHNRQVGLWSVMA
jgi:hypothetical protein